MLKKIISGFLRIIKNNKGSVLRILIVAVLCLAAIVHTVQKEESQKEVFHKSEKESTQSVEQTTESGFVYLEEDPSFEPCYVMICNAPKEGIKTTKSPSSKGEVLSRLQNGEIRWAQSNGSYNDASYYQLEDGSYLIDEDEYVLELKSYTKMSGYVVITFVSATGVKLRSWANFDDDNVAGRAFVGDQVSITAKVVTEDDEEAYQTSEGLYMTTDTEYFDDHTVVGESEADGGQSADSGEELTDSEAQESDSSVTKEGEVSGDGTEGLENGDSAY